MKNLLSREKTMAAIRRYRGLGIAMSVVMILSGILMMIFPWFSAMAWTIMIILGLIASGVMNIIRYAMGKKGEREGWLLANGIISLVIGLLFVISIATDSLGAEGSLILAISQTTASLLFWCIVFFAWFTIFKGIFRLFASGTVAKAGGSRGYEIAMGIVSIVLGVLITLLPFWSAAVIYLCLYVIAFEMIFAGCVMFIDLVSAPNISKVVRADLFGKEVVEVEAEPVEEEKEEKKD